MNYDIYEYLFRKYLAPRELILLVERGDDLLRAYRNQLDPLGVPQPL
jgi:hypothetical protein